jgi:hypothetical protein
VSAQHVGRLAVLSAVGAPVLITCSPVDCRLSGQTSFSISEATGKRIDQVTTTGSCQLGPMSTKDGMPGCQTPCNACPTKACLYYLVDATGEGTCVISVTFNDGSAPYEMRVATDVTSDPCCKGGCFVGLTAPLVVPDR